MVPPVKVRLYLSKAEFDALDADPGSGITGVLPLKILKNEDPIGAAVQSSTTDIPVTISGVDLVHGANGYVLQGQVAISHHFILEPSTSPCLLNWCISEVHCKTAQRCYNGKPLMNTARRISMSKEVLMEEALILLAVWQPAIPQGRINMLMLIMM
jgi:hypothetical protein